MSKTMNGFNQMNIKGEELLHFEMENAKNLKGKKLITTSKTEGLMQFTTEKMHAEETYGQDVNSKELMRRKGRTSSNFY